MEVKQSLSENIKISPSQEKSKIKENQIFVGAKPFMLYVRSAEILLRNKNLRHISIKARGMNIGKAVDLEEAIRHKFCADLNLSVNTIVSTDKFEKDGKDIAVSLIELILKR